ncbi:MAG TPA: acyl-CoA reductase [Sphingobacteriaceae bacterium]
MSRILTKQQRLDGLAALGAAMREPDAELQHLIDTAHRHNAWFTPEFTRQAVRSIGDMLNRDDLSAWSQQWDDNNGAPKKVGLVLAGNIPLVGLHDVLCVLAAGHVALIKQSSQDQQIIPVLLRKLSEAEPGFAASVEFCDRLHGYDAVIATGSNNSSRYFEYYFSGVPSIIRRNRNSVAVLTGEETSPELRELGRDIFDYFGLGCRNVSKIYVPLGYEFRKFFEAVEEYNTLAAHHKYFNNYEYNKSILLVNGDAHLDNGFLLVKKDPKLTSPLAVLHYEEYSDAESLKEALLGQAGAIQCVVSGAGGIPGSVRFGTAQHPGLWDYADGINTMDFLTSLS